MDNTNLQTTLHLIYIMKLWVAKRAWFCKVLVKLDVHFSSVLFLIFMFTQVRRFAANLQQSVL